MSLSDLFNPRHSYRNLAFVGRLDRNGCPWPEIADMRQRMAAAAADASYDQVVT